MVNLTIPPPDSLANITLDHPHDLSEEILADHNKDGAGATASLDPEESNRRISMQSDVTTTSGHYTDAQSGHASSVRSSTGSQATVMRGGYVDADENMASRSDIASLASATGGDGVGSTGQEVIGTAPTPAAHVPSIVSSTTSPSAPMTKVSSGTSDFSATKNEKVPISDEEEDNDRTVGRSNGKSATTGKSTLVGSSMNEKSYSRDEKTRSSEDVVIDNPELAHLNPVQRQIVEDQIYLIKRTPVTFFELFRYSTRYEIFLNIIGLCGAIVAGAAQPLMTVVFGALTTAFTSYGTALLNVNSSPTGNADLLAAKSSLYATVNMDVLYLVYIGVAMFVATFLYMATWIFTGEATTRRIRERYLKAVLRQNVAYFDHIGPGEVTTRIQTDTHLIQEGISDKIPITVQFLSTFVTGFVVALVRNWRLALVVSTIIPCIAVAGWGMNKFMSEYRRLMLIQTAEGGTLAEEVISSVRNTHAFGTQKKLTDLYDVSNQKTLDLGLKSSLINGVGMSIFFFIIYSAYGLAFYYGTTLILQGNASSGEIVNVFLAILIAAFSLALIAPNLQSVAFAMGAATSIFATIDRVPTIDSASPDGLKPEAVHGDIHLSSVDFIYPSRPAVQVLHDFSAVFPKGKMTALVGASGSGKSTIVGLIERFYDPVGGSIKLDNIELRELNVKWLRTQIGLVSQEPTLFATTVAGNIDHGLIGTKFAEETPEQSRERIIAAAVQANADGFIRALPEGYDTMIGERGMLLSGGQKQRIAIARAIVGDPQILLLDEATSALDTASEAIVQDALDRAAAGRTTITIAHRLSTIKHADQIIVMEGGRILESAMSDAETSAHNELLSRKDGPYFRLVSAQRFRDKDESGIDDAGSNGSVAEPDVVVLTREQADEIAKNEKPIFETLKRIGTGRSLASIALSQRNHGDEEAGKKSTHGTVYLLLRILALNMDRKWEYLAAVLASILVGCVYPVFGIVFGSVVGVFSETGDALRTGGDRYALYCFIIAIVATLGVGIQTYGFASSSERLSRTLRVRSFASILRQDIAYFDRDENSTGHLTSSVSDWAQKIQGLFGITLGVIIQSVFTLLVGSIIGLAFAWRLALVGIACYPLTIAAGVVRLQVVVLKDAKNKQAHEQSAQMACEAAGAIRTVASLTREDDCCKIYSDYLEEPQRQSNRTAIIANAWFSISQSLTFFVIGLIFWYGSHQLVEGAIDTRSFFICMISIIFGSIQAGNVFNYVPDMSKARGAAEDIIELFDAVPTIDAMNPVGPKVDDCEGHIVFKDVHFRYPTRPHVRVLTGLNIEVKPGQFVAIVGPSGCGKSTLIQLVERFYDPLGGTVSVDGKDISELNIQSYREKISLVSQEPTLYAGSVRFNITLGATVPADQVGQEEVEQACRDANIHEFVMSLPDGYDTEVGGKGAQLSGGQKQRIAIARALIRNPKILLLDEATSALDSESEKVVQKALDQASRGRSTIAVAHRLSTIQGADVIYVLKDGKVAEFGKHFELLERKGIYHELVSQQDLQKS